MDLLQLMHMHHVDEHSATLHQLQGHEASELHGCPNWPPAHLGENPRLSPLGSAMSVYYTCGVAPSSVNADILAPHIVEPQWTVCDRTSMLVTRRRSLPRLLEIEGHDCMYVYAPYQNLEGVPSVCNWGQPWGHSWVGECQWEEGGLGETWGHFASVPLP